MIKIDEIISMLDCNNDIEIQKKGIELARNVESLDAFVRPLHPQYNKNVWENCAKVLAEKSDEILDIFLSDLINWIRDINSPGAIIILERLKKVSKIDRLVSIVNESVHLAELANNYEWLNNLSGLLDNEKLRKELSGNTVKILEEYYNNKINH